MGLPLALLAAVPAAAQEPLPLQRLAGPIVVDGVPDEAAWSDIAPLPLTMYLPVFRGTPTQRTEIRVAYETRRSTRRAGSTTTTHPERPQRDRDRPLLVAGTFRGSRRRPARVAGAGRARGDADLDGAERLALPDPWADMADARQSITRAMRRTVGIKSA